MTTCCASRDWRHVINNTTDILAQLFLIPCVCLLSSCSNNTSPINFQIHSSFSLNIDTTLDPLILLLLFAILLISVRCMVLNYVFIHLESLLSSPPLQLSNPSSSLCASLFSLSFSSH
ncbi:hypothetical protein L873DRAFT_826813 [Choiromyces venosus 120613-1]|uniref:Uncharacterized protein n=1 Tax=Choiromyces venosus 120613-1 TaxID=1336337 RepID=A0A3N4IS90_9PEZI|nr:hypothetical protein L873DRAFT_826813 [Choiromyces venosus 120613-1]